jgi:hypothetical protein
MWFFIIVDESPLAGEDRSSTFILSCAPNSQPAFIEMKPADSQVAHFLHAFRWHPRSSY